jgi:hypothetical protein
MESRARAGFELGVETHNTDSGRLMMYGRWVKKNKILVQLD